MGHGNGIRMNTEFNGFTRALQHAIYIYSIMFHVKHRGFTVLFIISNPPISVQSVFLRMPFLITLTTRRRIHIILGDEPIAKNNSPDTPLLCIFIHRKGVCNGQLVAAPGFAFYVHPAEPIGFAFIP